MKAKISSDKTRLILECEIHPVRSRSGRSILLVSSYGTVRLPVDGLSDPVFINLNIFKRLELEKKEKKLKPQREIVDDWA